MQAWGANEAPTAPASLGLWRRLLSVVYGSGRAPNPHVVSTSLTWRNPPPNPPSSYLSGGGGRRRRRAAVATAAAGAGKGVAGILGAAGWEGVGDLLCGAPGAQRFSPREGKACRSRRLEGPLSPRLGRRAPRAGKPRPDTESAKVRSGPGALRARRDSRGKLGPRVLGRRAPAWAPREHGRWEGVGLRFGAASAGLRSP